MSSVAGRGAGIGIGISGNQLTTVSTSRFVSSGESSLLNNDNIIEAEVLDVDLDNQDSTQIGRVQFRTLNESGKSEHSLNWAYPISSNIRQYPMKNEFVCIVQLNGTYFYLNPINSVGFINNNVLNGITEKSFSGNKNIKDYRNHKFNGIPRKTNKSENAVNITNRNKLVPILSPKDGDIIIQGRFGNNIRLGSSLPKSMLPTLKFTLFNPRDVEIFKSTTEELDKDTCIWLTSEEDLSFNKPITLIDKRNEISQRMDGHQIILSSNRLIFNSKFNEILMYSKRGVHVVADGNVSIDNSKFLLINSKESIELKSGSSILTKSKTDTIFESPNIYLGGKDGAEPLVLGYKLAKLLEKLIDTILEQRHITATGPSSVPINSADFIRIKQLIGIILSERNYTL